MGAPGETEVEALAADVAERPMACIRLEREDGQGGGWNVGAEDAHGFAISGRDDRHDWP